MKAADKEEMHIMTKPHPHEKAKRAEDAQHEAKHAEDAQHEDAQHAKSDTEEEELFGSLSWFADEHDSQHLVACDMPPYSVMTN